MSPGRSSSPRTLSAYLALPRPADLTKAVIIPLGFVLAIAATGWPSLRDLARAGVVWFAVEYLAYQARYQWNDIRGFDSDQAHPDRDRRGRLPGPPDKKRPHVAASRAVLGARLGGAVLLAVVLPGLHLGPILLPAVAAVFAVAVVYEALRSRAAACPSAERPNRAVVALWFVSGAGYCVRGLTGVVLGGGANLSPSAVVVAGLACWMAGIVFVTTRWAVESIPFARRSGARLVWQADRSQGRGHLLPLTKWIPQHSTPPPDDLDHWRPLWARCAWHAPWNVAFAAALGLGWLAGELLAEGRLPEIGGGLLMVVVLAGAWAACVRRPHVVTGLACAVAVSAVEVAALNTSVAVALFPVTVCALYLVCTHQRLADVGVMVRRVQAAARATTRALPGASGAVPDKARAARPAPRAHVGGASSR